MIPIMQSRRVVMLKSIAVYYSWQTCIILSTILSNPIYNLILKSHIVMKIILMMQRKTYYR